MSTHGENTAQNVPSEPKVLLQVCALNNCPQGSNIPSPMPTSAIRECLSLELPSPPVRRHRLSTGDLKVIRDLHEEQHAERQAERQAERLNEIVDNRARAMQLRLPSQNSSNKGTSTKVCSNGWCPEHGTLQRRNNPEKGLRRSNAFYFSASSRCTARSPSDGDSENEKGIDWETDTDCDDEEDNASENHSQRKSDNDSSSDCDSDNDVPISRPNPGRALRKGTFYYFSASAVSHSVSRSDSNKASESEDEDENNTGAVSRLPNLDRPTPDRNTAYVQSVDHSASPTDERRCAMSFSRSPVDLPGTVAKDADTATSNTAVGSSQAIEGLQTAGQPQKTIGNTKSQQQRLTVNALSRLDEVNKMNELLETGRCDQSMKRETQVSAMIVKRDAVTDGDDNNDEEEERRSRRSLLTRVGSALRLDDRGGHRGRTIDKRTRSAVRYGEREMRSTKANTRKWFVRGRDEKSEGEEFADDKGEEEKRDNGRTGEEDSDLGKTVAWWL